MTATEMKPRVTTFAPQFLVDDLERSIAYYQRLVSGSASRGADSTPSAIWMDWNCI